jgi:hypothetical protein
MAWLEGNGHPLASYWPYTSACDYAPVVTLAGYDGFTWGEGSLLAWEIVPLCTWGRASIYASVQGGFPSLLRVTCLDCGDQYVSWGEFRLNLCESSAKKDPFFGCDMHGCCCASVGKVELFCSNLMPPKAGRGVLAWGLPGPALFGVS